MSAWQDRPDASGMWRVVLATGEVREASVLVEFDEGCPPVWSCGPEASARSARDAVLLWVAREVELGRMEPAEILAPGEPTRAELLAQRDEAIAVASAERDAARAERDAARAEVERLFAIIAAQAAEGTGAWAGRRSGGHTCHHP